MARERSRHKLHDDLNDAIGEESAGTLMELLPAYPWHEIATRRDLDAARSEIDGKIDSAFGRVVAVNVATMFGLAFAVATLVLAVLKIA